MMSGSMNRGYDNIEGTAYRFGRRIAEHRLRSPVPERDRALAVDAEDRVRGDIDDLGRDLADLPIATSLDQADDDPGKIGKRSELFGPHLSPWLAIEDA